MASQIALPTNRDRDLGLVLLFLSAVFYFAVPPLAHEFGLARGSVILFSTPIGLLSMLAGLSALFFSRKRISVEQDKVVVKDGFFAKPLHLRFDKTPTFKLTGFEEEHNGRTEEVWTVHMLDENRQYLIDRRADQQTASRALAEQLAKAVRGSLIEQQEGRNFKFGVDELDLCFVERVHRYPEMLGTEVAKPSELPIEYEANNSGIKVGWSLFQSTLLIELLCVSAALVAAAFIPLPGGPGGQGFTLFQAEVAEGDYRYFIGVGIFTVVSLVLLAGYKNTIELIIPKRAQLRTTIWGLPVRGGRIPLEELEHVAVTITSRGPYLQLISDKKILRERLPSMETARWLGWEFRRALAELSPDNCRVEQSVEMDSF